MKAPMGLFLLSTAVLSLAQAPEIFDVIPSSGRPGDILTIEGQDFDRTITNNSVHIGNIRARVLESSVTELKVEVPRGVQPGPLTVAAGGFSASSPLPFSSLFEPFGGTNMCYIQRHAIVHTNVVFHFSSADFDGDGAAELAVVTGDRLLNIYKYVGGTPFLSTNSFQLAFSLRLDYLVQRLVAMDYDSDGWLDLLLAGSDGFRYYRNLQGTPPNRTRPLSTNSFAAPRFEPRGLSFTGLQVVDLDRDGRTDLFTLHSTGVQMFKNIYDPRSNTVSRLFAPPARLNTTGPVGWAHAADLNRDGHMEIVVNSSGISVFSHHDRAGILNANSFTEAAKFLRTAPNLMGVADIEGDGFLDILGQTVPELAVFWNRTDGGHITTNLFPRVRLGTRPNFTSANFGANVLADLNGDGGPDLVTSGPNYFANLTANTPGVITSDSFSTSFSRPGLVQGSAPLEMADLNADGTPEFLPIPRGNILWVFENTCAAPPAIQGTLSQGRLQLSAYGPPMQMLFIESSRDLRNWTPAFSFQPNSSGEVSRSLSPLQNEFYRVRRNPAALPPLIQSQGAGKIEVDAD